MRLIAGFGYNSAADAASLADALARALAPYAHGHHNLTALAALEGKTRLVSTVANRLGLPVTIIPPADARHQTCLTDSAAARAAHGVGSVAEAVALAACGNGAKLLAPRSISSDGTSTAALAVAKEKHA